MSADDRTPDPAIDVRLGSMHMRNPVMVASGTFGYGPEYADLVDLNELGAIVVKGIGVEPTKGNPTPRTFETASGLLNAIGLPNPGFQGFVDTYMPFLRQFDVPVIVNIWGRTIAEYEEIARCFDKVDGVAALELNVSCPNIKEGAALFGTDLDMFQRVVSAVRENTRLPLIPKLAPNVNDIAAFARAAESCGADAISLINSIPGMAIDVETRRPRLGRGSGGLTGPAIRPVAVKLVYEAAQAVRIPIVGIGGITCAADALEFILAGATAVAIGTANFTNPATALEVVAGLRDYLGRHGASSVGELVGAVDW